ncbi:DUF805 domain-containing protein [Shewanella litorisediminis]|uniref:DUF805 domain-containing protein n=1 Tax=Shewanella litorisediminis TaxID=1173586 RepID=A0ABX7G0R1_9GAMM|nr:DUF805 domain-containing protein [Shewanella litorisediminis]MCL2919875.1 DUF805 domain-containing protein [Shewanella litorisediminis]QRH00915.1 DUF805 domain-containing protein [Shewanella litorisediminis]
MEYYIGAWKKYADFTGRARRKEFWMFFLFNLIVSVGMNLVDMALGSMLVGTLYSLAVFLPSLAIGARRLHDTGRSGWWQLIALIPIIGIIVLIVFYCQDSQDENDYGENPKAFA